jgi:hypothetical protein
MYILTNTYYVVEKGYRVCGMLPQGCAHVTEPGYIREMYATKGIFPLMQA